MIKEKPKRKIRQHSYTGVVAAFIVLTIAAMLVLTKITQSELTMRPTIAVTAGNEITIWGLYHQDPSICEETVSTPSYSGVTCEPPPPKTLKWVNGVANYKVALDFVGSGFDIPTEHWVAITGRFSPGNEHIDTPDVLEARINGRIQVQSMKEAQWPNDLSLQIGDHVELWNQGWFKSGLVANLGWWNLEGTAIPLIVEDEADPNDPLIQAVLGQYVYISYPQNVAHPPNGPILQVASFYRAKYKP